MNLNIFKTLTKLETESTGNRHPGSHHPSFPDRVCLGRKAGYVGTAAFKW